MKHCPNSECPGMEVFKTVSEFNDTALACSDCGGALVTGPAPSLEEMRNKSKPAPEPEMELVPIFIVQDESELLVAESVLHGLGIQYLAKGEQIQDMFGYGRIAAVNPIIGPVEIYVGMDDAEAARNVLAETLEEDSGQ